MSELLNAFNRIHAYLESNYPDVVAKLPLGLQVGLPKSCFPSIPIAISPFQQIRPARDESEDVK